MPQLREPGQCVDGLVEVPTKLQVLQLTGLGQGVDGLVEAAPKVQVL